VRERKKERKTSLNTHSMTSTEPAADVSKESTEEVKQGIVSSFSSFI
jgi:hypothetical protein